jgi:hypothetical protein
MAIFSFPKHVDDHEEALALPELHDEATKYAVLHLIEMLSPIRDLISELSHSAYDGFSQPPFPKTRTAAAEMISLSVQKTTH